jgi:hypothetical protein
MVMGRSGRIGIMLGVAAAAALITWWVPPVPQDAAYHRFADARSFLGVPNALNVLSNLAFLIAAAAGLRLVVGEAGRVAFVDSRERWPWAVFFAGLGLTGLGSAWYHLDPGNVRLVWDRLPMTVAFMGLFAAMIGERIGPRAGLAVMGPLLVAGAGSVLWWHAGEQQGHGDLRAYGLVQFFPMLAIPLLAWLFPARYTHGGYWGLAVLIYAAAKGLELADARVLALGGVVSGHALKHLGAALAGGAFCRMLALRTASDGGRP